MSLCCAIPWLLTLACVALRAAAGQGSWDVMLADAMRVQSRQTATFAEQLGDTHPMGPGNASVP